MSSDMANNIANDMPETFDNGAYVPTYKHEFPPLTPCDKPTPAVPSAPSQGQWANKPKLSVKTSTTTQIFRVPLEERRYKEMNETFGQGQQQAKICMNIMQQTGVAIEMSLAKDQSLTVVITGKMDSVMKAKRLVIGQLQTQASLQLKIPREYHKNLLGRGGKKLQDLELNTATRINIPRPEDNSDTITISGTKEGIDEAAHKIQLISDEQAKLAFERLAIPKVYHPFIYGPNNSTLKSMVEYTGARINIPPPTVMKDEITVSGEKEGVHSAVQAIMKIYEEKKKVPTATLR